MIDKRATHVDKPFFSVVIPALNEESYLPNLLEDLNNQSSESFEVIVVDGNSEDDTFQKAQEYKQSLNIRVFQVDVRNVSYQRNFGGKKARGEWVIFMDADNRLPTYFLDGLKYQIAKHNDVDVFSTWMSPDDDSQTTQVIARTINTGLELYDKIGKPAAFGALIGTRKKILKTVTFDETQKILEDTFFIRDVIAHNYHFQLFKEPRFIFSFRRLRKQGTLKMLKTTALTQFHFLQGKDFTDKNYGYDMEGGNAHDVEPQSFLHTIQTFIQTASQKQLDQAKKIIASIKEFEG